MKTYVLEGQTKEQDLDYILFTVLDIWPKSCIEEQLEGIFCHLKDYNCNTRQDNDEFYIFEDLESYVRIEEEGGLSTSFMHIIFKQDLISIHTGEKYEGFVKDTFTNLKMFRKLENSFNKCSKYVPRYDLPSTCEQTNFSREEIEVSVCEETDLVPFQNYYLSPHTISVLLGAFDISCELRNIVNTNPPDLLPCFDDRFSLDESLCFPELETSKIMEYYVH